MPPPLRRAPSSFHLAAPGTRYLIRVEPPPDAPPGPWPVVLCLDGDDQFPALRRARATLAAGRPFPPLLLVGVGYGASYREPGNRRVRDYTPVPIEGAPDGGGADAFLDFLVTRLWPELARLHPIDTRTRGIAGHSLGALFALHALFKPSPFFNRVLAGAPSLWWGDRVLLRRAAALRASHPSLPARLFLGVGLKDSRSMVDDLDLLERQLAEVPFAGLEVRCERFPGRDHFNSLAIGFRAGLSALFSETPAPA